MYQLNNAAEYLIMTAARLPDKLAFADDGQGFTFAEILHASMSAGERIYKEAGGIRKRIAVIVDRSALSMSDASELFLQALVMFR